MAKSKKLIFALAVFMLSAGMRWARDNAQPAKRYVITDHGAVGDGKTLNTPAIQAIIDRTSSEGGGVVVVPKGTFHHRRDLPQTRREPGNRKRRRAQGDDRAKGLSAGKNPLGGRETQRSAALLCAIDLTGVEVTGEGTIDGSGDEWIRLFNEQKAQNGLPPTAKVPVPPPGRPKLICFQNCRKVRIAGLSLAESGSLGPAHPLQRRRGCGEPQKPGRAQHSQFRRHRRRFQPEGADLRIATSTRTMTASRLRRAATQTGCASINPVRISWWKNAAGAMATPVWPSAAKPRARSATSRSAIARPATTIRPRSASSRRPAAGEWWRTSFTKISKCTTCAGPSSSTCYTRRRIPAILRRQSWW